jgi:cysteine synthase
VHRPVVAAERRLVQPAAVAAAELLDELPWQDSNAIHSRQDLKRVNWWMGNVEIVAKTLLARCCGRTVKSLVEWGAGDGNYLLRLANRLRAQWPGMEVILVDSQNLGSERMRCEFTRYGWRSTFIQADILDWLSDEPLQA